MPRLFVAINPPPDVKDQLIALMDGVSGARWQTAAQLHLTLSFIGDVDDERATATGDALAEVRHPPFSLSVDGVGAFERHALWAGLAPNDSLTGLQQTVEQALTAAGLSAEDRPYRPHITLARLGRAAYGLDAFLARHRDLDSPPFPVDEFCLYRSTLTSDGSVYKVVARYLLSR